MARRSKRNTTTDSTKKVVTDSTEQIFRSGVIAAAKTMPLCAPAIRALTYVETPRVPTMAIDKHFRVYVNPQFIEECVTLAKEVSSSNPCVVCGSTHHHPIAYVAGVICHEIWHPLRQHHLRAENLGLLSKKALYVWNLAADAEINDDLINTFKQSKKAAQLCLPPIQVAKDLKSRVPGVIVPSTWNMPDGLLVEDYYYALNKKLEELYEQLKASDKNQKKGETSQDKSKSKSKDGNSNSGEGNADPLGKALGDSGSGEGLLGDIWHCGSGADGQSRPYESGEPTENNPIVGISEAEARMIRQSVARNITEAVKTRGTVPAGWQRWADGQLDTPKYDWRAEMNKMVRYALTRVSGRDLRTFRRLGRRTASLNHKAILPHRYRPLPRVGVVQDTSGSMNDEAIVMSMSEVDAILKAAKAEVSFIACDAAADEVQTVRNSARNLQVHGGGGTDMRIGIHAALEVKPPVDMVVLFTDGYTPWPDAPLPRGVQLIVCLVGNHACEINKVPSWAHTIKIIGDDIQVSKSVQ